MASTPVTAKATGLSNACVPSALPAQVWRECRHIVCLGNIGKAHRRYVALGCGEQFIAWWPSRPKPATALPLLVYLHGSSCRGQNASLILAHGEGTPPRLVDDGNLTLNAVVLSPLLKAGSEWAKTVAQAASVTSVLEAVLHAAKDCKDSELPSIDSSRVYCTGASCGGLGTYMLAARLAARSASPHPSRLIDTVLPPFAAIVPVCGGGHPVFAKLLVTTPSWFWHAEDDVVVSVSDTDAIVNALENFQVAYSVSLDLLSLLSSSETVPRRQFVTLVFRLLARRHSSIVSAQRVALRSTDTPPPPPYCSWMHGLS